MISTKIKLSVTEIAEFSKRAKELGIDTGLPTSRAGVNDKVSKSNWPFEHVSAKGGKDGTKKVYELPSYVIEELREKGALALLEEEQEAAPKERMQEAKQPYKASKVLELPPSMRAVVAGYDDWAAAQDKAQIVPVRYYSQVFASAGNGAIPWDTAPEAMWFRASFFDYLGTTPARCFCTRIKGDSMSPTLIDRGTALWQATARYTVEGIYLFRQHEELRVKRLQRVSATLYNVISDNDNKSIYPTTELDLTRIEPHDFEIFGRYLWDCGIAK